MKDLEYFCRNLNFLQELLSHSYYVFLDITDMIKRRNLRTRSIKMLILDESDEMLNKGNEKLF